MATNVYWNKRTGDRVSVDTVADPGLDSALAHDAATWETDAQHITRITAEADALHAAYIADAAGTGHPVQDGVLGRG